METQRPSTPASSCWAAFVDYPVKPGSSAARTKSQPPVGGRASWSPDRGPTEDTGYSTVPGSSGALVAPRGLAASTGRADGMTASDQVQLRFPIPSPVDCFFYPESWGMIMTLMRSASRSLWVSCYTLGGSEVIGGFEAAFTQGADIRVMADRTKAQCGYPRDMVDCLSTLSRLGSDHPSGQGQVEVRLFEPQRRSRTGAAAEKFPASLHAKFGIVDNKIAWIGSQNLTENSSTFFEAITILRHPPAVAKVAETFTKWWDGYTSPYDEASLRAKTAESRCADANAKRKP